MLLQKRLALVDILIVFVMAVLLYDGASWQIFSWYTDAGKYQCYSVAFWQGVNALKTLPVPSLQCHFITNPRPETVFITTRTLVSILQAHRFPVWLISFVASQSPTQPLRSLPHEYPLISIIPFTFGLVSVPHWYQVAFAVAMAVIAGSIYFLLCKYRSRKAAIAFALYMVVSCWATALARYDIIPAGLTLVALLCAERRRWRWAFFLLALATMFKFYPLVLVPAFFIAQQKSKRHFWCTWWSGLDVYILVCGAITTLSLVLSVEGTLGPLGYFGNRPIQAESTASSLLWLASFFGYPLHYAATYGSLNVLSPLSSLVSTTMTVLSLVGIVYALWLQWRGRISLGVSILLTLLVVICTGKVFSPQYLLWVVPFVAYLGECDWKWLASWSGIGLLTTWVFPYIYSETTNFIRVPLMPAFHPVVFARNVLLIVFLLALLYHHTQNRRKAVVAINLPVSPEPEMVVSMAQHE